MSRSITIHVMFALLVAFTASEVLGQGGRGGQGNRKKGGGQSGQNQTGRQTNANGTGQIGRGKNSQGGSDNPNRQIGNRSLSAKQQQDLILMREEEKLARDVYLAMNAKWGATVFKNISRAESRHMKAIANLLSRYNISDPVKSNSAGSFTSVRFQQLYKTLVRSGSNSLVDALKVGLKIEEMDIADLRNAIRSTSNQDIRRVYQGLERGSINHLRAFASQLKRAGGSYDATILSQTEFNQIANGRQQRGDGQGQTEEKNKGQGQANKQGQKSGNTQGQGKGRGGGKSRGGNGRGQAG